MATPQQRPIRPCGHIAVQVLTAEKCLVCKENPTNEHCIDDVRHGQRAEPAMTTVGSPSAYHTVSFTWCCSLTGMANAYCAVALFPGARAPLKGRSVEAFAGVAGVASSPCVALT